MRGSTEMKTQENTSTLEEKAEALITCTYENNTLWGKEVSLPLSAYELQLCEDSLLPNLVCVNVQLGLKYGCPVEDVLTGLAIQCRGWRSICYNPSRRGFLGFAPTTLGQTLVQHSRWSEGNFQIILSKHCPFIQGHGKINLGLKMAYSIYGLWAPNSLPTLYYLLIPPLCFLNGISLYPKVLKQSFPFFIILC